MISFPGGRRGLTVQGDIFVKLDSMRHGKLDCLDFEVVARKSPGEIGRGNHMLSKPTKGVFVADVKDGLLINVGSFICRMERVQPHSPDGSFCAIVLNPKYVGRFGKLDSC